MYLLSLSLSVPGFLHPHSATTTSWNVVTFKGSLCDKETHSHTHIKEELYFSLARAQMALIMFHPLFYSITIHIFLALEKHLLLFLSDVRIT